MSKSKLKTMKVIFFYITEIDHVDLVSEGQDVN